MNWPVSCRTTMARMRRTEANKHLSVFIVTARTIATQYSNPLLLQLFHLTRERDRESERERFPWHQTLALRHRWGWIMFLGCLFSISDPPFVKPWKWQTLLLIKRKLQEMCVKQIGRSSSFGWLSFSERERECYKICYKKDRERERERERERRLRAANQSLIFLRWWRITKKHCLLFEQRCCYCCSCRCRCCCCCCCCC